MTEALGPRLRMPWALLGTALVLAVVLAGEWIAFAGGAPLPAAAAPAPASAAPAPENFAAPAPQLYAEIAARPLFEPGRRPVTDAGPPRQEAPPPSLSVQGVVLSPTLRYAIVAHGNPTRFDAVTEGDTVEGWRVEAIGRDTISMSAGDAKIDVPVGKPDQPASAPPVLRGFGSRVE